NFQDLEELDDSTIDSENTFDLEIIEKIDNKVLSILHYLNIGIYNKKELKKTIINDMLDYLYTITLENNTIDKLILSIPEKMTQERYIDLLKKIISQELKIFFANSYKTDENNNKQRILIKNQSKQDLLKLWCIINSILWYIENHIDYEFSEYQKREVQIKKDLWEDLLNKISSDIETRYEEHRKKRVKKISKVQVSNFLNFLFEEIDEKYLKVDKKEKKLNNEDYLYLKKKTREYIQKKYFEK
ncbi:MAG TPA: hypothetical protein PK771_16315, partial [Spirochaetota bacterium]|nr:hypothetical protein [Spirochaetota bacterium]